MTDLIPDEDGFTELVDPRVPRVDLVGSPANGSPGWLLMKQDAGAGLLDPNYIRDLIGKSAELEPAREDTVTMTGSPGALMKLIHEASLRREGTQQVAKDSPEPTYEQLVKAKYNAADRKRMAANGQAMDDGSYPIADREDLDRAIHAVGRGGSSHDAIRRHIIARAKALGASSEIPDNWAADGSLKEGSVSKMIGGDIDDGVDGMDPTVVLAEPDDDEMPGDPNDPGSPAWESIDAATAQKWLSIAYRVKNALGVMAERELLEAASADPDDAEDAWDLQDAQCAMDYVIGILANFAADEQAEAVLGAEAMDAVGKALAGADAPVGTIEALASVKKAGRTLSAANEQAIRDAVASLQKVLASLPAAPVEKTANEEPKMPTPETSQEATAESGQEPAMGSQEPMAKTTAEVSVSAAAEGFVEKLKAGLAETGAVAKADDAGKKEVVVVYDQKGRLVGIVDPDDITPVANAEAEPDDMNSADDSEASDESSDDGDDTQTPDLTPQPAEQAGTPADATTSDEDDGDGVTKSTHDNDTDLSEMLKSSLLPALEEIVKAHSATQEERVAVTGAAVLELAEMVKALDGEVKKLGAEPAEPKVFTQGAGPRPLPQHLRGQNSGAPIEVDLAKAAELREQLYRGTNASERDAAFHEMQGMAIAQLEAMRRG